jgi:Domain of unknown function (DUF4276)
MTTSIGCIVEGQGEVVAVPRLLHRIAREVAPQVQLVTPEPIRRPRGSLIKELERDVELMARKLGAGSGVLVLLDADDDCPASLGPELLSRCQHARPELSLSVVVAKVEFEAWFLAAARSLAGVCGLPADLQPPADPESIKAAKAWLSEKMDRPYSPPRDQATLVSAMDIHAARSADSFDKCYRDVSALLAQHP